MNQNLPFEVLRQLRAQGRTLATAESCTGGLIGKLLTDVPGSSVHATLCGIFHPNSVAVARYGALIRAKYPTNCDAHLAESLFQTRSGAAKKYGRTIT